MTLSAAKAAAAAAVKAASKAAEKAAAVKQPAGQGGLTKAMPVSATLKRFVGSAEISRTETMRKVWAYIKDKNLQDPEKRKEIVCDDTLKQLFSDKERVTFLEIPRLLSAHFPKKGQS